MWYDSHCHFDFKEFDSHRQETVSQLKDNGCDGVLIPGITNENWSNLISLKKQDPEFFYIALGLHPYFISQHTTAGIDALRHHIADYRSLISAVGEIGLDFYSPELVEQKEQQTFYFSEQVRLAKSLKLPLIIHSRKSHDQVFKTIKEMNFECGGIVHGFSGSLQQAQRFIDRGLVIGLGGALTHERAQSMHKLVAALGDDDFVLETDAPDMRPSFALDKMNSPLHIPQIAEHIAKLRKTNLQEIFNLSSATFKRVMNLS